MHEHRIHAIVRPDRSIDVADLPLKPGDKVDVTVRVGQDSAATPPETFPLPGPYRFDDPLSPVGVEDWDALR